MNTALNTPLPWTPSKTRSPDIDGSMWVSTIDIYDHYEAVACYGSTQEEAIERRNLAVKAVNEYASLRSRADAVEALEKALKDILSYPQIQTPAGPPNSHFTPLWTTYVEQAKDALALVAKDRQSQTNQTPLGLPSASPGSEDIRATDTESKT